MIANIKDYKPECIEFSLPNGIKEMFPSTLFEGAESLEQVMEQVYQHFVATFPEFENADRMLDSYEREQIREEYCLLQENEIPKRRTELAEAIETAKRIKREAEERLAAVEQTIFELAGKVKKGVTEYEMPIGKTFRIALNGYYLYYVWEDNKVQLAKAERIPEWDKRTLWSQTDANRKAMMDLFGYEFPEEEQPTDEEEDKEDF